MLFVTEYRERANITREHLKRLMGVFAEHPKAPGEIAHYARMDGSGGYVVLESNDVEALYESVLRFEEFFEFTITPVLHVEDAVGPILRSLES